MSVIVNLICKKKEFYRDIFILSKQLITISVIIIKHIKYLPYNKEKCLVE